MTVQIITGDCVASMRELPAASVQCCVTSPPYFGLRDYGHAGQIGLEETPAAYVAKMVEVFMEVHRVLRNDGTLWLNLGDTYARNPAKGQHKPGDSGKQAYIYDEGNGRASSTASAGLPEKNLIGIPWRVAFALQDAGWFLRQDIIWSKPNPMPESIRDRCTKAHEYVFLFAKSSRYYFDAEAIKEEAVGGLAGNIQPTKGARAYASGAEEHRTAAGLHKWAERQKSRRNSFARESKNTAGDHGQKPQHRPEREPVDYGTETRNRRSVWTIPTQPFSGAHFATFPPELPELCIKAGSREGDTILDPFGGAGTTGLVADRMHRNAILCELNPEYAAMARRRISNDAPLFGAVS